MKPLDITEALIMGALMGLQEAQKASALIVQRRSEGKEISLDDLRAFIVAGDEVADKIIERIAGHKAS